MNKSSSRVLTTTLLLLATSARSLTTLPPSRLARLAARSPRRSMASAAAAAQPPIILGSGSSTRQDILKEMGFEYTIKTADIDERAIGDRAVDPPHELVLRLGKAKAEAIVARLEEEGEALAPGTLLLTGDQVVVHRDTILEKPDDVAQAEHFIRGYFEAPCRTVGSVVLTHLESGTQVSGTDTAAIYFSPFPEEVLSELLADPFLLKCAGGLMVEHPLIQPYLEKIEGTQDSVMGLSKALVLRLVGEMEAALAAR